MYLSAACVHSVQGYFYIESFKEAHVKEAIRGLRNIFGGKGAKLVPMVEMVDAISVPRPSKALLGDHPFHPPLHSEPFPLSRTQCCYGCTPQYCGKPCLPSGLISIHRFVISRDFRVEVLTCIVLLQSATRGLV